jgi:hypothetical protein
MRGAALLAIAHAVAGYAQLSVQPGAILLCPWYGPLSSRHCARQNGRASWQLLSSAAKARTLQRSICFLSAKCFASPENVWAIRSVCRKHLWRGPVPPVFAPDSPNGLPWEPPSSRQHGVLSTSRSQSPAVATSLRAFPRAGDGTPHVQTGPACVDGDFPSSLSRPALSIVFFSGIIVTLFRAAGHVNLKLSPRRSRGKPADSCTDVRFVYGQNFRPGPDGPSGSGPWQ